MKWGKAAKVDGKWKVDAPKAHQQDGLKPARLEGVKRKNCWSLHRRISRISARQHPGVCGGYMALIQKSRRR